MLKIFIGSLPKNSEEDQIHTLLSNYGHIDSIQFTSKNKVKGKICQGHAIALVDKKAFDGLIAAHCLFYNNAQITINPYLEGEKLKQSLQEFNDRRIFIHNLDKRSKANDIYRIFSSLAPLENVLIRENLSHSHNTTVVLFKTKEDAQRVF